MTTSAAGCVVRGTLQARPPASPLSSIIPPQTHMCSTDVRIWISSLSCSLHRITYKFLVFFTKSGVQSSLPSLHPSCPLYLSTHLLSFCEAVALRGRISFFFGNLPSAMIGWVREQIITRNISRIFTSSHQALVTGCPQPLTLRLSAPLRWNSWEQEIGRLWSTCLVSQPLPRSPQRPPL